MRLTIERLRTLVLISGALLIVALGVFLGIAKWRNPLSKRDLPQRLGVDIRQEANGWTYTHEVHGRIFYKIHASKLIQLKQGSHVLLHDVRIELYGEDGTRTDRIEGSEFEYDPESGIAKAGGPVEIKLMRPGVAPAIAPNASATQLRGDKGATLAAAAQAAGHGEIAVKTSGLTFDRNTAQASTNEKVEFALTQGIGSAVGALYDGHRGQLVLDHSVQMITQKGDETVVLNARHAEFEQTEQTCDLLGARVGYREGEAQAENAKLFFREDGTAVRLEASQGVSLTGSGGGQVTAPAGLLEFNEQNEPRHGRLWGGVTVDTDHNGRKLHGTSPTMEMQFAGRGDLRNLHLERNVQMTSDEQSNTAQGGVLRTHRTWASPVADVEFRSSGRGKLKPSAIHGTGGVVVAAESQRGNGPATPSRLAADDVTGSFDPGGRLESMTGTGHASIVQTTPAGTRQTTSGNKLVAHFSPGGARDKSTTPVGNGMQVESATVDGDVVLIQEPAVKAGAPAGVPLRATAGLAVYQGTEDWLHLTENPRVVNGGLELTADRIDVSQGAGDAFAHGNVKATWNGEKPGNASDQAKSAIGQQTVGFGGEGPAHIVAKEAELNQSTGEATFKGNARLWQQANSIAAPIIVLDRTKQTLIARSAIAADPVQVVLMSATGVAAATQPAPKGNTPSVVRVRGSDFKYSSAERKALMRGSSTGTVVATTADANTTSNELELILLPPGNHSGKDGTAAQVDRMTSSGHVVLASQGRRGRGEKLVYSGETGDYVLTGTASSPPRITDPTRGMVTGEALIFNGHDDSVSIEGGGQRTTTVTTAPK